MNHLHISHEVNMSAKKQGGGFQSAAGLIRYFDEEEAKGPMLDHRFIIIFGIACLVVIELAKWQWPV